MALGAASPKSASCALTKRSSRSPTSGLPYVHTSCQPRASRVRTIRVGRPHAGMFSTSSSEMPVTSAVLCHGPRRDALRTGAGDGGAACAASPAVAPTPMRTCTWLGAQGMDWYEVPPPMHL
jgi:hypothetical protein